jgi:hypothetical protein
MSIHGQWITRDRLFLICIALVDFLSPMLAVRVCTALARWSGWLAPLARRWSKNGGYRQTARISLARDRHDSQGREVSFSLARRDIQTLSSSSSELLLPPLLSSPYTQPQSLSRPSLLHLPCTRHPNLPPSSLTELPTHSSHLQEHIPPEPLSQLPSGRHDVRHT